jgi:hypothetical protein
MKTQNFELEVIEMNMLRAVSGGWHEGNQVVSFKDHPYPTLLADPAFQRVTAPGLADLDSSVYFGLGSEAGAGYRQDDQSRIFDIGLRQKGPNGTLTGPIVDPKGYELIRD